MNFMNDFIDPFVEDITLMFRESRALTKETSKSLEKIGLYLNNNPNHKLAFNYLKGMWYIRKYKGNFYLDEYALEHPSKTYFKRFLYVFTIVFPVMILLLSLIVIAMELKLF